MSLAKHFPLSAFGLLPLLAAGLLLLAGCEDTAPPETATTQQIPKRPELPRIKWLDAHSEIMPEQWLASREAKTDLDENDPAVVALRTKLKDAARRFGDAARMIANRAVQLEEMLAEEGISEHAPELIDCLSSAATRSRQREGFGSLTQHYFNLRKTGVDRDAALEQLKKTSVYWSADTIHRS